jgi:hypothetical protein
LRWFELANIHHIVTVWYIIHCTNKQASRERERERQ